MATGISNKDNQRNWKRAIEIARSLFPRRKRKERLSKAAKTIRAERKRAQGMRPDQEVRPIPTKDNE